MNTREYFSQKNKDDWEDLDEVYFAIRIKFKPFEMYDEYELEEELQEIGCWLVHLKYDQEKRIVCMNKKENIECKINNILNLFIKQQVKPEVDGQGTAYLKRNNHRIFIWRRSSINYKIEINGEIIDAL